jgi:hypothetical protein
LDKELKIAVARPAFRNVSVNLTDFQLTRYKNLTIAYTHEGADKIIKNNPHTHNFYVNTEEEKIIFEKAEHEIRKQQVLLGVVGIDVPVLRLISKVSPKYQMGVGIYIIMIDNNGFVVFHPSIKKVILKLSAYISLGL